MAVPKRRTSQTRKNKRRTHFKLTLSGMSTCPECGELKAPHHACRICGTYKGRQVLKMNEE